MAITRLVLTAALLVGVAGCARVPARQGFIIDPVLAKSIRVAVDNKASVQGTMGRPSFIGQFDQNDWYYISRDTRQLAYRRPVPSAQTILHVRFDAAGNVAEVKQTGLEQVAAIRPVRDRTPTLGRNRSFFEDIFGNIGQVGSVGTGGGTTDNPGGN